MRKLLIRFSFLCLPLFFNFNTLQAQILADAGPDQSICKGDSVQIGGNPTGLSGSRYQWSNSSTLSNSTAANPKASPSVTTTYTVTVSDINGRSNTDQMTITVETPVAVDAGKDTLICKGDSVRIGGSQSAPSGSLYQWTNANSLDSSMVANPTAFPDSSTVYALTITDTAGCINSDSMEVAVFRTSISQKGIILSSTVDSAMYQWIDCNGDTAIAGADSQTYVALANGNYAVEVRSNGCVDTSACINVFTVGTGDNKTKEHYEVYPNPTNSLVSIRLNATIIGLQLYSINGKLILDQGVYGQQAIIDLSGFKSGVYYLHLFSKEAVYQEKIIKQ